VRRNMLLPAKHGLQALLATCPLSHPAVAAVAAVACRSSFPSVESCSCNCCRPQAAACWKHSCSSPHLQNSQSRCSSWNGRQSSANRCGSGACAGAVHALDSVLAGQQQG
jgi:hypothetical protein